MTYNRRNPDAWQVLAIDTALPIDPTVKACLIRDMQSWSQTYLLWPTRIFSTCLMALTVVIKRLLPFPITSDRAMHVLAVWFLNTFVTPEACYLIVRHFGIGSNILNFLTDNGPDPLMEKSALFPKTIKDLGDNAFMQHDLNLYNFVYDFHRAEERNPNWLAQVQQQGICFDSVQPVEVNINLRRRGWLRFLDLETTLELIKLVYAVFLTPQEFKRAVLSLQLDENIGLYVSKLTNDYRWNHVIYNRHPLAPNSPLHAGKALLMHGIMTEHLYRYLELAKLQSQQSSGQQPSKVTAVK